MITKLKNLDIFGHDIGFKFEDNRKFKTPIGGILTLFYIALTLTFIFIFCKDFYTGSNPKIYTSVLVRDRYEEALTLSFDKLIVPWRIDRARDRSFVDISELNFYVVQSIGHFNKNENGSLQLVNETYIPVKKCSELNFKVDHFNNYFKSDEWYCFDWGNEGKSKFGGYFDGDYINIIRLDLSMCPFSQPYNKENCTSLKKAEENFKNLTGLIFSILYPDAYLVSDNLINPLRTNFKSFFRYVNFNEFIIDRYFLERKILSDDQGKIFEDIRESSSLSYSRSNTEAIKLDYVEGGSSNFYRFVYFGEKNSNIYRRSYMKLQDAGALIGGIVKSVTLVFYYLSYLFNIHQKENCLIHSLFESKPKLSELHTDNQKLHTDNQKLHTDNQKLHEMTK